MLKKWQNRYRDTDYLALSAQVRTMEPRLLGRERQERMLEAREDAEVVRVLTECGYPEPRSLAPEALEECLAAGQEEVVNSLRRAMPEKQRHVFPVFQIKHDYHNAKALIKAQAMDVGAQRLLTSGGRYDPKTLAENFRKGELGDYSPTFAQAVTAARELLATSRDPQRVDFLLDRACYEELSREAKESGSPFVEGYVAQMVDALNLRVAVRARRNGQSEELLREALLPGGAVAEDELVRATAETLPRLYRDTPLQKAAELGGALLEQKGGDMTAFERACDDALGSYVAQAHRVPFGVEPVVGYLHARQEEATAIRIICSGRMAGLDREVIRERLREAYG